MDKHFWTQQPRSIIVRLSEFWLFPAMKTLWICLCCLCSESNRTQKLHEKMLFLCLLALLPTTFSEWFGPMFNVPVGHLILRHTNLGFKRPFQDDFVDPRSYRQCIHGYLTEATHTYVNTVDGSEIPRTS